MTENTRAFRKTRIGTVVSDKMDKTIVVAVEDSYQHPLYKKTMKRTYKLKRKLRPCIRDGPRALCLSRYLSLKLHQPIPP